MSIQKKILSMTIGPVVLLGLLSIFFMLTTVHSSMMEDSACSPGFAACSFGINNFYFVSFF